MQLNQASAEKIMADMKMEDVPLVQITRSPQKIAPDWFARYRDARRKFMMELGDAIEELAFLNLSQSEFMDLLTGRAVPRNMSIRMRIPLVWGGEISPENMFMCATFPVSQNMDRFILMQSDAASVWLPSPVKKIYISAHTGGGGAGGNATEDRLSQMAAQIAAGRGME